MGEAFPWRFRLVNEREVSGEAGAVTVSVRVRSDGALDVMVERAEHGSWWAGVVSRDTGTLAALLARRTPWPDFQASLRPRQANSATIASLRRPDAASPPQEGLPVLLARSVGLWEGWANRDFADSVALAVDEVDETGGHGRCALAGTTYSQITRDWRFVMTEAGELSGPWGHDAVVTIRPRPDAAMDFMCEVPSRWIVGVLSQAT